MSTPAPLKAAVDATAPKESKFKRYTTKSRTFMSNHKRPIIAICSLTGLIVGAAYAGRATADKDLIVEVVDNTENDSDDTNVA